MFKGLGQSSPRCSKHERDASEMAPRNRKREQRTAPRCVLEIPKEAASLRQMRKVDFFPSTRSRPRRIEQDRGTSRARTDVAAADVRPRSERKSVLASAGGRREVRREPGPQDCATAAVRPACRRPDLGMPSSQPHRSARSATPAPIRVADGWLSTARRADTAKTTRTAAWAEHRHHRPRAGGKPLRIAVDRHRPADGPQSRSRNVDRYQRGERKA